jgi:hypothetical protein
MSFSIPIISKKNAEKAARDITAYTASVYRLSASKITFSDLNNDIPGMRSLLKEAEVKETVASNSGSSM